MKFIVCSLLIFGLVAYSKSDPGPAFVADSPGQGGDAALAEYVAGNPEKLNGLSELNVKQLVALCQKNNGDFAPVIKHELDRSKGPLDGLLGLVGEIVASVLKIVVDLLPPLKAIYNVVQVKNGVNLLLPQAILLLLLLISYVVTGTARLADIVEVLRALLSELLAAGGINSTAVGTICNTCKCKYA